MSSATGATDKTYTRDLAQFATRLRIDDIPTKVVDDAKRLLLDGLGCALFGITRSGPKILAQFVEDEEPRGSALIWGTDITASCTQAAMVNGCAVHGFELDDAHPGGGRMHAASVVVPPVLALAQHGRPISGETALLAMIAGIEIGARVGKAMGPEFPSIGWHPPAACGVFPAAVAAGVCTSLTESQMGQAFGLAATQAGGLRSHSMSKSWHAGKAAQSGLYAALLAARGFTGPDNVLDSGGGGFCRTFSQGLTTLDLDALTADLGMRWETSELQLKIYTCQGPIHTSLDAIKQLRRNHDFDLADIEKIHIRSGALVARAAGPYEPGSQTSAQMSLGYNVAVMLSEGACFIDQFRQSNLDDPRLVALASKLMNTHDLSIDALGPSHQNQVELQILLRDGRVLQAQREFPAGSAKEPISSADLQTKFRELAAYSLNPEAIETVIELTNGIDRLRDVAQLVDVLRVTRRPLRKEGE